MSTEKQERPGAADTPDKTVLPDRANKSSPFPENLWYIDVRNSPSTDGKTGETADETVGIHGPAKKQRISS
ncbi:MAG: hypothetical protein DRH56_07390 [Deltaproteobacteria bacterium]|nr:MAG: hypothetical protein DRH56_07390 [Deltaproteobacteria bacterium]